MKWAPSLFFAAIVLSLSIFAKAADAVVPADLSEHEDSCVKIMRAGEALDQLLARAHKSLDANADDFAGQFFDRLRAQEELRGNVGPAPVRVAQVVPQVTDEFSIELNETLIQRVRRGFREKPTLDVKILGTKIGPAQIRWYASTLASRYPKATNITQQKQESMIILTADHVLGAEYSKLDMDKRNLTHRWSPMDQYALSLSSIDSRPHEAQVMAAYDETGHLLASSGIHGNMTNIYTADFEAVWDSVFAQLHRDGTTSRLKFFEITHSHPFYESLVYGGANGSLTFFWYPLSPGDLYSARYRSRDVPQGVILKDSAAVPNGYSDSVFYLDGVDVTRQVQEKFKFYGPKFGIPFAK
jgi:hypothetical protein